MLIKVRSLGLQGMYGYEVTAECDLHNGLPAFDIVGLPDAAVKEARERVRAAVKNSGYSFPVSRITVNLAPANLRKSGTVYDLPILIGILAAQNQVYFPDDSVAFVGELSLSGTLRPVIGMLPMALAAQKAGIRELFVPAPSAAEATLAEGLVIYPVQTVTQLVKHLTGEASISPATPWQSTEVCSMAPDFSEVKGQEQVKRVLEIAAAGGHNVAMIGPPGSGKSMLAKRLPSILPPLRRDEALEVSAIHSILGLLPSQQPLITQRPFRSPHHTISSSGMAGGGNPIPRPGEISLAHHGVLFLDEMPEFHKDVLEILRQPMEDGKIQIVRAAAAESFPSDFMLVAAMNPCKCGWHGHPSGRCRCTSKAVTRYLEKLSGPLLDRIDLFTEVPPLEFDELSSGERGESSRSILARVLAAREHQSKRFGERGLPCNAQMGQRELQDHCAIDELGQSILRGAYERMGLTARGYDRILRVARTIADLEDSERIEAHHLAEALQYRAPSYLRR